MSYEAFLDEQIIDERKLIGSLPDGVPHEAVVVLADDLDTDPEVYFERKTRAAEIAPILKELGGE